MVMIADGPISGSNKNTSITIVQLFKYLMFHKKLVGKCSIGGSFVYYKIFTTNADKMVISFEQIYLGLSAPELESERKQNIPNKTALFLDEEFITFLYESGILDAKKDNCYEIVNFNLKEAKFHRACKIFLSIVGVITAICYAIKFFL